MIPHAIISRETYEVTNVVSWDRKAEWSPEPGHFVVRLDGLPIQPSIGWTYDQMTMIFAPPFDPIRDGKVLLGPDGNPIKVTPKDPIPPQIPCKPVNDPIRDLPHYDINWELCDQGQQSDKFFRPNADAAEVYEDRMKLPDFQYVHPTLDSDE